MADKKRLTHLFLKTTYKSGALLVLLFTIICVLRVSSFEPLTLASAQGQSAPSDKSIRDVPPLYPIRLDGRFGYMDSTGRVIVSPQFQRGLDFHDGMARVDSDTQGHGIIDATGKVIFLKQFLSLGDFSEGLARVGIWDGSGKSGYIDKTGSLVIPTIWASYGSPGDGLGTPMYWRMDRNGNFSEGLAVVRAVDGGKFGYIDKMGKVIISPQFLYARPFSEGLAAVANDQFAFGYVDSKGKVAIPLTLQNVFPGNFSEGLARVKGSSDITFVDHHGNSEVVVKTGFYFAGYDFHDGMARIKDNNVWTGFINRAGHIVVEPHYRYATDFSEGLAAVADKDGTAGYINSTGKTLISLPQDSLGCQFRGGLARVFVDDPTTVAGKTQHHSEMAYVDRSGKFVVRPSIHTRTPQLFGDDGLVNCD